MAPLRVTQPPNGDVFILNFGLRIFLLKYGYFYTLVYARGYFPIPKSQTVITDIQTVIGNGVVASFFFYSTQKYGQPALTDM